MIQLAPRKLALISLECTRWARNIALATGKLDYTEIYDNNFQADHQLSNSIECYERFPLMKRKCLSEDSSNSNAIPKRRRVSGCETLRTKARDIWYSNSKPAIVGS